MKMILFLFLFFCELSTAPVYELFDAYNYIIDINDKYIPQCGETTEISLFVFVFFGLHICMTPTTAIDLRI